MSEATVMVNRLAQGLVPMAEGTAWFAARPEDENRALLRELAAWVLQARARTADVPAAVARSGTEPTHTPAVLASRGVLDVQLAKVGNLPADEFLKAFRLLVALLAVADERRRERDCGGGCSHWWHHLE